MSLKIADDHVVSFHYTLTNNRGEELDSSVGAEPLTILQGAGNIIPGLEDALAGKTQGDAFKVTIQPEDGYGVRHPELMQVMPREAFAGVSKLEIGMEFTAQGPNGHTQRVGITAIDGDDITIDGNHPLAGEVLHFAVTIEEVRKASNEELEHGHVHGPGGHHHS
jgi:FKBP-type peptidyl-prolyl cis-trans isomerase SlyD